jgi:type VI protein secretion system component VasF
MTIQFSTDPAHIGQMRQSAESIMKTVHWSSPTSKESVDRGARAQEKRSGKTYDWVAGLALLLVMVAAMFGLKSRTKRQS